VRDLAAAFLPLLLIVPIIDWVATFILVILAVQPPRIPFLVERAAAATVLSIVMTSYALIALNTESGFPIIDWRSSLAVIRLLFVVLGAFPVVWIVLYARRRHQG